MSHSDRLIRNRTSGIARRPMLSESTTRQQIMQAAQAPSLRARMIVSAVVGSLILGSIFLVISSRMRSTITEDVGHRNLVLAQTLAGQVHTFIQQPLEDLRRVASGSDDVPMRSQLRFLLHANHILAKVQVLDERGLIVMSEPDLSSEIGLDMSNQAFFRSGRSLDQPYWSPTCVPGSSGKPTACVSLPIGQQVLVGHIALERLNSMVNVASPGQAGFIAIVDGHGTVLAHSDPELTNERVSLGDFEATRTLRLQGSGTFHEDHDGQAGLTSVAPIPETAWGVIIHQSEAVALHALDRLERTILLVVGVGVPAGLLALLLLIRSFLQPLKLFANHAKRFVDGDFDSDIQPGYQELKPLASTLRRVGRALRQRERDLLSSRERYRELVQHANSIIIRCDARGVVTFCNEFAAERFGLDRVSVVGKQLSTLICGTEEETAQLSVILVDTATDEARESACRDHKGERIWVSWSTRPIEDASGKQIGILAIGQDVTERRRSDRAVAALVDAMSVATGQELFDAVTASLCQWLGCPLAFIGTIDDQRQVQILAMQRYEDRLHSGTFALDGTPCEAALEEAFFHIRSGAADRFSTSTSLLGEPTDGYVGCRISAHDGSCLGVLTVMSTTSLDLPARADAVFRTIAGRVSTEIERMRSDLELRANRSLLAQAQRMARLGSWELENGSSIMRWSDEVYRNLDLPIGTGLESMAAYRARIHPEDRDLVEQAQRRCLQDGQGYHLEYRVITGNGAINYLRESAEAILDTVGHPVGLRGTCLDISEQRHLEEQLHHAEKMQAIGQLAGGIAHDFNNQLTGIKGYAELIRRRCTEAQFRTFAEHIVNAADRAADLTKQLLAFARRGKTQRVQVDIHASIHDVCGMLSHSIDRRITIEHRLEASTPLVEGDPTQLQNALLNLAINARDAMPDGGTIRFTTSTIMLGRSDSHDQHLADGAYLRIAVSDSGQGIPAAIRDRIFEPFFTTKAEGHGTGMGLAAVYGTVINHGGTITVESEEGVGSTFLLTLPIATASTASSEPIEVTPLPTSNRAHLLVIDDEEMVRTLTAEVLRDHGYRCSVCERGREAVAMAARLAAQEQGFDLVLLDMIMPDMSGPETFRALRANDPDLAVIIISGYSPTGDVEALQREGRCWFLQKPFDHGDLLRLVAETLNA